MVVQCIGKCGLKFQHETQLRFRWENNKMIKTCRIGFDISRSTSCFSSFSSLCFNSDYIWRFWINPVAVKHERKFFHYSVKIKCIELNCIALMQWKSQIQCFAITKSICEWGWTDDCMVYLCVRWLIDI